MKYKKEGLLPYLSVNNNVFGVVDMQGFTKLTESFVEDPVYGAERISELIQEIFTPAVNFVVKNKGNIIGFTGDGFVFSLPDQNVFDRLKARFNDILVNYAKKTDVNISFRMNKYKKPLYFHTIEGKNSSFFFYHYKKPSNIVSIDYKKAFPEDIFSIFQTKWLGKLIEVPIGFVNIDKSYKPSELSKFFRFMVDKAYNYGIYLNKILYEDKGWSILLTSGDPVFVDNSPKIMINFLKEIFDEFSDDIELKAGVTLDRAFAGIIGSSMRWEYTFIGRGVNLASRISTALKPAQIGVDTTFRNKTMLSFKFNEIMRFKPKGLRHEEIVYSVVPLKKTEVEFAGREELIKAVSEKLNTPLVCMYIEGPAGIGKTALTNEILKKAGKQYIILHCEINSFAFAPFESFFSRTGSIYNYISDVRKKQFFKNLAFLKDENEYREFVKDVLLSVKDDIVIFIDDLPFMDEMSLSVVRWLLTEELKHINLVFTGRDFKGIGFLSSKLNVYEVNKIELKGLGYEEIFLLIKKLTKAIPQKRFAEQIEKVTEGNPLFIVNIIDYLRKHDRLQVKGNKVLLKTELNDIPYSLKEFIRKRLNELEVDVRRFLEVGSIVGDNFETDIALRAADIVDEKSDSVINKAIEHKMITIQNTLLSSFYHALVRETVFYKLLKKEVVSLINAVVIEYEKKGDAFLLFKAGRLLEEEDNERAIAFYFKGLDMAIKEGKIRVSVLIFKRLLQLSLKESDTVKLLKLSKNMVGMVWDMDTLHRIANVIQGLSNEKIEEITERIHHFANHILSALRDTDVAYKLLKIFRTVVKRPDFTYYLTLAKLYIVKGEMHVAEKLYEFVLKYKSFKKVERFELYISLLEFYFFHKVNIENVKIYLKKLNDVKNDVQFPIWILEYLNMMSSIYLHWQQYDKAEKYIFETFALAKKLKNRAIMGDIYNNLAIVYGHKASLYGDKKYKKLALMYSKRVYKLLKKNMVLNFLPLITTNLATTYFKAEDFKNAYKYYKLGLLYGKEINHPVEVPFTLTMLSRMLLHTGAYRLAANLVSNIKNTSSLDLKTYSYLMTYYFITHNNKDIDLALEKAVYVSKEHIIQPLMDYIRYGYIIEYQKGGNFNEYVKRIRMLINEDKVVVDNVKNTLLQIDKMKACSIKKKDFQGAKKLLETGNFDIRSLIVVIEYARCIFKKDKKEAISIFKYALRIARRMKAFPYEKIVYGYFIDEGYNVSYYKRRLSIVEERLRKINSAKTIDDFDRIIHDM